MITYDSHETSSHVPTFEGSQILQDGSHEARVWSALPSKAQGAPLTLDQLKKCVGDETAKVGQGRAFKNGWIAKEGNGFIRRVCFFFLRHSDTNDSIGY
jgi:phenylalanyl-tRNA synthetase alpha chain